MREQHRLGVLEVSAPRHRHPEVAIGLCHKGIDDVEHEGRDRAGLVTQVHPEEGRHLVVARTTGPQPAADVGTGSFDEAPLQRGVDVLVAGLRHELPRLDVGAQGLEAVEHGLQGRVVEQARGVQDTCVGPRPGQVVGRQSPVEVGGLRQGRQRIGRAAGEPAAPQADTGGRIGGGHAGSLRAWDIRVAATSREAASPVVMTMIVSSPAMVPTMPGTEP